MHLIGAAVLGRGDPRNQLQSCASGCAAKADPTAVAKSPSGRMHLTSRRRTIQSVGSALASPPDLSGSFQVLSNCIVFSNVALECVNRQTVYRHRPIASCCSLFFLLLLLLLLLPQSPSLLLIRTAEMDLRLVRMRTAVSICWLSLVMLIQPAFTNPDAKRLYDDLLSHYNRLIRPVSNNSQVVTVRLGLHLTQLIDLVRCVLT